ncbi:MAG: MBL fold metallo-hydrolase [Deltaproteobacteria bacterium]|nr:MBL fold metallo-hydrolase [Deltaproteobacteria bacterium]
MKVHHLSCASLCPVGGRLVTGRKGPAEMTCHCLLIESDAGLVLVDTGIGSAAAADPVGQLSGLFVKVVRPRLEPAETAVAQLAALGFSAREVRHVIPTHLDLDHAGGLPDFPGATVHVFEPEYQAAMARDTTTRKRRYQPAQWAHEPRWVRYEPRGEPWFGFETVRALEGLPPEILLVPLPGHSTGLCGVAVQAPDGWLLHAGDAYFHHAELEPEGKCPVALRLFQRLTAEDNRARVHNQTRLRALAAEQGAAVRIFSAHDPVELSRLRAQTR